MANSLFYNSYDENISSADRLRQEGFKLLSQERIDALVEAGWVLDLNEDITPVGFYRREGRHLLTLKPHHVTPGQWIWLIVRPDYLTVGGHDSSVDAAACTCLERLKHEHL